MNIELGIGIGSGTLASLTSNDRLVAFAWAMAGTPNVSTSTVIHKSITSVPATSNISALVPIVSNADNVTVIAVIANANGNALIPSVAIAGSISISAVVASSNTNLVIPAVSVVRNVSVGGVVANNTASAGVPTISTGGGGTTYYLQMDGVDDNLKTPSITFDEIIMDIYAEHVGGVWQYYLDSRTGFSSGYFARDNLGKEQFGSSFSLVYVNGVQKNNLNTFVPSNQRVTIRLIMLAAGTDDVNIYSNKTNTEVLKGKIYSVKFYNNAVLVADYDMSTGTVQDQSGNGNHATLTGGTWVVA